MDIILNTYGLSLNRDNECFIISTRDGKQRIPTEGVKSIQVCRGVQVTSDAIMLAIEHEIEILFVDKAGTPMGRVWSSRFGSNSTIRKGQLNFCYSHEAVDWIKTVIDRKIENQQAMMLLLTPPDGPDPETERSIRRLEDYRSKIRALDGEVVHDIANTLRGWEGQASHIYFATINDYLPACHRFEARSQHPALDVVNALLNYGYGILYGRIEGMMIKSGVDPYIGILHRDNYNRPVLVYDVIELYRIWVDYVVYTLVAQGVVTDEYYSIRPDGSYWLEPLGRRILIQSLIDYLEEVITIGGERRSRLTVISQYIQSLAQKFKKLV